jgi:DNA-binding CsgD family transcriptional regulator
MTFFFFRGSDVQAGESRRCHSIYPGADLLRQLFGLTGAEAKLAARMASGRSLKEIVSELRVSMGTARTQLRSIFAKTHTHR